MAAIFVCIFSESDSFNSGLSLAALVAYVGFLNVSVAHSHPVMLVFCHLLINRNSDRGLEESSKGACSEVTSSEATGEDLEGMLCIFHFLFFFFSRLSNGHGSKKYLIKKGHRIRLTDSFFQCHAI